jgi:adenine-specific DNA-methyltransferase
MSRQNYRDLTHEQLVSLLEARDRRAATRYGLVWETDGVEAEQALNGDYVALDLVPELCSGPPPWRNLVIEGDNFDALRALKPGFSGKVRCLATDPPYNTGNRDFLYNDRFIDKEDLWRHSKWLEFMFQRLTLARDLLAEDGAALVHIGEEEIHRLACLMDRVFPNRKVGTFVWRTRNGANDSKEYFRSIDHEYILCYANSDFIFGGKGKELADYSNPDGDERGDWVSSDLTKAHNFRERSGTYYPIQNPENGIWYPCNPDRVWAYAKDSKSSKSEKLRGETMKQLIDDKKVLWPEESAPVCYEDREALDIAIASGAAPKSLRADLPDLDFWVGKAIGRNMPRRKKFKTELKRLTRPLSTWIVPSADKDEIEELINTEAESEHLVSQGTSEGTALLRRIMPGAAFPFPKPLELVKSLIKQSADGNSVIMDIFAGSGTVGHAVAELNAEDGGNRRFVVVSNTEATTEEPQKNICRDICAERIRRVLTGYSYQGKQGQIQVPGLGDGFAYLRCRRVPVGGLLELEHPAVWTALQLRHLEALLPYDPAAPFQWAEEGDSALCYVPRFRKEDLKALRERVDAAGDVVIYSWQPGLLRQHLRRPLVTHEALPAGLSRPFGLRL